MFKVNDVDDRVLNKETIHKKQLLFPCGYFYKSIKVNQKVKKKILVFFWYVKTKTKSNLIRYLTFGKLKLILSS